MVRYKRKIKGTMSRIKRLTQAIKMELREHKVSFILYMVLRILVIAAVCLQIYERNFESVFLGILTLILLVVPSFVQVTFKIEIPTVLECIVLLFIFAAEILGEINGFYVIFPFWDTMLHTMNGFLAAAIGFSLVDILNKSEKLIFELSPFFAVLVAFCFSMTIGVVWEIFEFGMDQMGGFDMQKDTVVYAISSVHLDPTGGNTPTAIQNISDVYINGESLGLGGYLDIGLYDTMYDLIVNFVGAVAFSVIAYLYLRNQEKGKWIAKLIMRRKKKEEDFLEQTKI